MTQYDCAEVIPGLYIGSITTGTSIAIQNPLNIEVIINLSKIHYASSVPVFNIDIDDIPITDSNIEFYRHQFMQGLKILSLGKRTLVHCVMGINRSATLIALHLIWKKYNYNDTIRLLCIANLARKKPLLTNSTFNSLIFSAYEINKDKNK